jgi:hypothetical protein
MELSSSPPKRGTWTYVIVLLLNTSALAYALGVTRYFPYPVTLATVIALLKTPPRSLVRYPTHPLFVFFVLFTLGLLFSCLYQLEMALLVTAMGIITSLIVLIYLRAVMTKPLMIRILELTLAYHIVVLAISLSRSPFAFVAYQGIFRNPNVIGCYAGTALMVILALTRLKRYKLTLRIGLGMVALLCAVVIIVSSSRTAVLAAPLGVLVWMVTGTSLWRLRTWLRVAAVSLVFLVVASTQFFYTAVLYKFVMYAESGDILNHRGEIWRLATGDITLFGHGRAATVEAGVGESIYIAVLHEFGAVSLALFLIVVALSIISPLTVWRRNNEASARFLLPIILFFVIQGITGSIFGLSVYFLWIVSIAYALSDARAFQTEQLHVWRSRVSYGDARPAQA